MTHHPIKTLPDGTRVYANYHRYKPMDDSKRTNKRNKPDHPGALRFHGKWFLPLELLDDASRVMPETVPDDATLDHRASCFCRVCKRPQARRLWAIQRRKDAKQARS